MIKDDNAQIEFEHFIHILMLIVIFFSNSGIKTFPTLEMVKALVVRGVQSFAETSQSTENYLN